jgi:surface antigen
MIGKNVYRGDTIMARGATRQSGAVSARNGSNIAPSMRFKSQPSVLSIKGDDYPFRSSQIDTPDGWGFLTRECTSFVAWRMRQLGVDFTNGLKGGWFGNAATWADNARKLGYRVDNTPLVGAIAHYAPNAFLAGPSGHVAYVAQVNGDSSIVIEEFNWAVQYAYHNPPRITHPAQVSNFIHIAQISNFNHMV